MIIPLYESESILLEPHSSKEIFSYSSPDTTSVLESFSFFCSDERAFDVWVSILLGNAKIQPFNLLKGYRSDDKANLFINSQDRLRITIENRAEVSLTVDMHITLRKYS